MEIKVIDRAFVIPEVKRISRLYTGKDVKNIECLGGGSFGIAYRVDFEDFTRCVTKIYKVNGMNRKEAESLKILRESSKIKIPEVYFVHDETPEIPFDAIGMEYVYGVSAESPAFLLKSPSKKRAFAEEVADNLHHIHQKKNDKFGFLDRPIFSSWKSFYSLIIEDVYNRADKAVLRGELDRHLFKLLETGYMKMDYILKDDAGQPTLCHADLNVQNIMVDKKTMKPISFIDPFNSMWGDVDYDLFQLNNMTGPKYKLFETYKNKYGVSDMADLKCAFYAHVNEILCYLDSGWKSDYLFRIIASRFEKELKKHGLR